MASMISVLDACMQKRLLQFVDVFVEEAADAVFFVEIVAADSMMESGTAISIICNFLTSMSTSHFRSFRHTATTISKLTCARADVC